MMMDFVEKYKALGCKIRVRIMLLLLNKEDGLYVCDLVNILGVPQYNVSKHLAILRRVGLVTEEREGKKILYKANLQLENEQILYHLRNFDYTRHKRFAMDLERLKTLIEKGKSSCDT